VSTLPQVVFFSLVGGLFSLVGGALLLARQSWANKLARYATPFAAGAMLAAAFMDLMPEAIEGVAEPHLAMLFTMLGLLSFFILETVIHWSHDHTVKDDHTDPLVTMVVIGDTVHNFLDGVAIAAGFLISPASGIIVTLAVAAHEIPHEIGDFGLMLDMGVKRGRVLLINVASSLATTVAATIFFLWGNASHLTLTPTLSVVAGFFIYIAAADIIPTLHEETDKGEVVKKTLCLLAGVFLVYLTISAFHNLIG